MQSNLNTQAFRSRAKLIPSEKTAKEFGKVYVLKDNQQQHIELTMWDQDNSEGWNTGVALDSSVSMQVLYGKGLKYLKPMTPQIMADYASKNFTFMKHIDGQNYQMFTTDGIKYAKEQGLLAQSTNEVEPVAKEFISYLNDELESGEGCQLIYWASGKNGDQIENLGCLSEKMIQSIKINGADVMGTKTYLAPALNFFLNHFNQSKRILLVFITDGKIDDLEEVKKISIDLAQKIERNERPLVKAILIGLGDKIDETQMEELDDLETNTDIDIWDHKIAKTMRDLSEIGVELVNQEKVLASSASIFDDQGNQVHRFLDGLTVVSRFSIPINTKFFELEVMGNRIKQELF